MTEPTFIVHNKIRLAVHELRAAEGRNLLLLHGLGERSPEKVPEEIEAWPGPVYALDFTGHGHSTIPVGGGYTAEMLMGDADAAMCALGPSTVVGRGLGAYVALLIAGAQPEVVEGAVLLDGPGMAGGGPRPADAFVAYVDPDADVPPDPWALVEMACDVRPPDYAVSFARQALQMSPLAEPITICAIERPDWLRAVVDEPGVLIGPLDEALARYSR